MIAMFQAVVKENKVLVVLSIGPEPVVDPTAASQAA